MASPRLPGFLLACALVLPLILVARSLPAAAQLVETDPQYLIYLPSMLGKAIPTATPTATPRSSSTATRTASPTATRTATATPIVPGSGTPTATRTPTRAITPGSGRAIIANHQAAVAFDSIPDSAIAAASAQKVFFAHASTGAKISQSGLNYLQGTLTLSPYPRYQYDRRNWSWLLWDPPQYTAKDKVDRFATWAGAQQSNYDLLGMKFCYIDWWQNDWTYYRDKMLQLEAANPTKTFIWSTMPVLSDWSMAQPNQCQWEQEFNNNIRAFALANGKVLFDIAALESHDPAGNPCFTGCETMCAEYGGPGHPNNAGAIQIAKGFWWLVARVAGWSGN
jgi:hypothetical protein